MMKKFKYTVFDKNSNKLEGYINAVSEEEAHKTLHNYGFSIMLVREASALDITNDKKAGKQKFIFEGYNKDGKKTKGVIDDDNLLHAFSRLVDEYSFNIQKIYKDSASKEEIEQSSKMVLGIIDQLAAEKLQEAQDKLPFYEKILSNKKPEVDQEEKKVIQQMVHEITKRAEDTWTQYPKFNLNLKATISSQLEQLEIIRNSNNIDYIYKTIENIVSLMDKGKLEILNKQKNQEKDVIANNTVDLLSELGNRLNKKQKSLIKIDIPIIDMFIKTKKLISKFKENEKSYKKELTEIKNNEQEAKMAMNELTAEARRYNVSLIKLKIREFWMKIFHVNKFYARLLEIREQINNISDKKLKIVHKIKKERNKLMEIGTMVFRTRDRLMSSSAPAHLLETSRLFSMWLLVFYVIYIVIANLSVEKNIILPYDFALNTMKSSGLYFIIAGLIIYYVIASLKMKYFFGRLLSGIVLFSFGILLFVILLSNLRPLVTGV